MGRGMSRLGLHWLFVRIFQRLSKVWLVKDGQGEFKKELMNALTKREN